MADTPNALLQTNGNAAHGPAPQDVAAERDRLRLEVSALRREVLQLRSQAEMLRQEWYQARSQEEEYRHYIKKLTGIDPYISPQELLDAEKYGGSIQDIIEELEGGNDLKPLGA